MFMHVVGAKHRIAYLVVKGSFIPRTFIDGPSRRPPLNYGPGSKLQKMDFTTDDFVDIVKKPTAAEAERIITFQDLKAAHEQKLREAQMSTESEDQDPGDTDEQEDEAIIIENSDVEVHSINEENDNDGSDMEVRSMDLSECDPDEFLCNQELFDFLDTFKINTKEDVTFILKVTEKFSDVLVRHNKLIEEEAKKKVLAEQELRRAEESKLKAQEAKRRADVEKKREAEERRHRFEEARRRAVEARRIIEKPKCRTENAKRRIEVAKHIAQAANRRKRRNQKINKKKKAQAFFGKGCAMTKRPTGSFQGAKISDLNKPLFPIGQFEKGPFFKPGLSPLQSSLILPQGPQNAYPQQFVTSQFKSTKFSCAPLRTVVSGPDMSQDFGASSQNQKFLNIPFENKSALGGQSLPLWSPSDRPQESASRFIQNKQSKDPTFNRGASYESSSSVSCGPASNRAPDSASRFCQKKQSTDPTFDNRGANSEPRTSVPFGSASDRPQEYGSKFGQNKQMGDFKFENRRPTNQPRSFEPFGVVPCRTQESASRFRQNTMFSDPTFDSKGAMSEVRTSKTFGLASDRPQAFGSRFGPNKQMENFKSENQKLNNEPRSSALFSAPDRTQAFGFSQNKQMDDFISDSKGSNNEPRFSAPDKTQEFSGNGKSYNFPQYNKGPMNQPRPLMSVQIPTDKKQGSSSNKCYRSTDFHYNQRPVNESQSGNLEPQDQWSNRLPTSEAHFHHRAQFPHEILKETKDSPKVFFPPGFNLPKDEITTKFLQSIKNMEVSEVISSLNNIATKNPAFKGIHSPSLMNYLGENRKAETSLDSKICQNNNASITCFV
ncbi:hypothetical protein GDO86_011442 [Hymenochirus boettgeri]|uniref:Uncharacterized protein n=1 Tax=Hymenochirus boettgeri TaxID=247094 RepID=A0A8T2JGF2_9PIPI|nr:hypothetical protein GDO86_011442 [Hymenochirus boettgeri]